MTNPSKQIEESILTVENIKLLKEFPKDSVNFIARNLDEIVAGNVDNLIEQVISHLLVVKGKQVLSDALLG